jgi:hypothetical protein
MRRKAEAITTDQTCSYGCGAIAKYKNGSNKLMCATSSSKCPEVKRKNSSKVKAAHEKGNIPGWSKLRTEYGVDTVWNRGLRSADFSYNGKGSHKAVLLHERGHRCENCGLEEWLGDPIPIELEHRDGDNKNNQKENLLLLCPNCHAKTEYYRGRNIPNQGRLKVSDDRIVEEINKGLNNRQVLINVGLTPKGANYDRVNSLRSKF